MKALAVDSASPKITFVAINEYKRCELSLDIGMHQSEMILPSIENVLANVDLSPADLDFTALCLGPGTFTGLRLAFAALKALTIANNTPIYAIPSLEAYAFPYGAWKGAVVSVIDAKKDRFYASIFRNGKENTDPMDAEVNEIVKFLDPEENILVVGPDADLFVENAHSIKPELALNSFGIITSNCGNSLIELGYKKFVNKEVPLQDIDGPIYIRPSEAELSKKTN